MVADLDSFLVPFFGALQASIAVLLTIFAGVVASQFNLISERSSKDVSKVCVKLFMPALLIINVGSELNLETGFRYLAILIWGVASLLISMFLGLAVTKTMNLPNWVRLAITFNNTTSLPLLLVEALSSTNLLDSIDPSGGAVSRAKSYFLVNSMISNSLTFAIGPKMLNGFDEDGPDEADKPLDVNEIDRIETQEEEAERANEETSLLPNSVARGYTRVEYTSYERGLAVWRSLPPWAKRFLDLLYQFVNPPVIGTLLGALIGLVPALHRLFFNSQEEGGYFNAWLTSALKNVGDLFAALQVVVTGVKLSHSMIKMKKGESSGRDQMQWSAFVVTTIIRFFVWPAISIAVIYVLAKKTNLLSDDPILWFCMMLMPTGPSALVLTAMADVTGGDDDSQFAIAKFLTVTYAVSPIIFLTVVGSLKASEAAAGIPV